MKLLLIFIALPLLADEKPAPQQIDAVQQAQYQTLRAQLFEAQARTLQARINLDQWINQVLRSVCTLEIRDNDQITCQPVKAAPPAPKAEPKKP